jgi:hypothetical protein
MAAARAMRLAVPSTRVSKVSKPLRRFLVTNLSRIYPQAGKVIRTFDIAINLHPKVLPWLRKFAIIGGSPD